MATIFIDGKPFAVHDDDNLLHACLSLGFDLPYFCWHPALGSVGACRQCAVKQFRDEKDTHGRLVMACMTPTLDGARFSIADPEATAFRASVIEWLMVNHPHDCPICDEGGECHLQDMTVMARHTYRRYRFNKRTFRNQYLGPFINHEMNRCIACYRCVRFYREYAGGRDLDVFAAHNHVYFGRAEDGVLENEFSGNLVEVCPTGVFTDKTLKAHYTRKWDLQTAPSVCTQCGLGCNTIPGERYGVLRRIRNRYHSEVNGYFLCDRGRYGYDFVNSDRRLRQPVRRTHGSAAGEPISKEDALRHLMPLLGEPSRVIGIGSPRASLEANFALRTLVGSERFFSGMSENESRLVSTVLSILRDGPARAASLQEVEQADAVFVLGEDVMNTAPRLALALRQSVRQQPLEIAERLKIPAWNDAAVREAVQHETGPLFIATVADTKLDDVATRTYHAAPDDLARLGFAVAHELNAEAPDVPDLPGDTRVFAGLVAHALKEAQRPLVVSGVSSGSAALIQAAANIAWSLCSRGKPAQLCFTVSECNSMGLGLMGGNCITSAFAAVGEGWADTVIILENDLYRRAEHVAVDAFLRAARHVIVLDSLETATTARAEVVLPASTFAEADGTLVNNETRAQRFFQVFVPEDEMQESWRWLRDVLKVTDRPEGERWQNFDDVTRTLAETAPEFARVTHVAPPADFRVDGQKIPRQPARFSGRTAMLAQRGVHEPKPPDDPDTALAFSMQGYAGQPPAALIPRFWAPGWNSVQATGKFQSEVGGPLRGGDPGLRLLESRAEKLPLYFSTVPAAFAPRAKEWLIVPLFHIFGSEETSMHAPAIVERAPEPYVALNPADGARLQVTSGDEVDLYIAHSTYRVPVRLRTVLPHGVAGLPVGLPQLTGMCLPTWSPIVRVVPRVSGVTGR